MSVILKHVLFIAVSFGIFSAGAQADDPVKAPASLSPFERSHREIRLDTFSGEPVPRYSSLRFPKVHGRKGPSAKHTILWIYQKQGLPVLVTAEDRLWRRIIDPDGEEVWVHRKMLTARRTVYIKAQNVMLLREADKESLAIAAIDKGSVADLIACKTGWRRIELEGRRGWVPALSVWGADDNELICN